MKSLGSKFNCNPMTPESPPFNHQCEISCILTFLLPSAFVGYGRLAVIEVLQGGKALDAVGLADGIVLGAIHGRHRHFRVVAKFGRRGCVVGLNEGRAFEKTLVTRAIYQITNSYHPLPYPLPLPSLPPLPPSPSSSSSALFSGIALTLALLQCPHQGA